MRLIVYLLALLTGFSAANAAEARRDAPAALDVASAIAEVAQSALASDSAAIALDAANELPGLASLSVANFDGADQTILPAPVMRSDRARE